MTTIIVYALCIIAGDIANRKTTFFHPVGWAGIGLTVAGIVTQL